MWVCVCKHCHPTNKVLIKSHSSASHVLSLPPWGIPFLTRDMSSLHSSSYQLSLTLYTFFLPRLHLWNLSTFPYFQHLWSLVSLSNIHRNDQLFNKHSCARVLPSSACVCWLPSAGCCGMYVSCRNVGLSIPMWGFWESFLSLSEAFRSSCRPSSSLRRRRSSWQKEKK